MNDEAGHGFSQTSLNAAEIKKLIPMNF